jgi:ABC-type multidrug transport system ATPase subunit
MTTHSMEEADLLADSIGVMSKGQIQVLTCFTGTKYLLTLLAQKYKF